MKKKLTLFALFAAICAAAWFCLTQSKEETALDFGDPNAKFRFAEQKNLSPYAMFGDSSVVLLTEHERLGKQLMEIVNSDEFSRVKKLEFYQNSGKVKLLDPNGVVVKEMFVEPDLIARFLSVDPMSHERSWLSPYNYVQNNPINRIDPTGALDDPIFDSKTGDFLGHYGDSDFEGEIMLMNKATFNKITNGQDVVISYELAEQNGSYMKDLFSGKEMPTATDLKLLSNVFTNLLVEADNAGLMNFDRSKLDNGRIGVSGADGFTYPAGYNYADALANTGPIEGDGQFKVWANVQYYNENRQYVGPNLNTLSHAGNAISILGIHEYGLHGVAGLQGNANHPVIYPKQWELSKNFVGGAYKETLRKRAGQ